MRQAPPIDQLIDAFSKLPGIGRKTASRLAFHILRSSRDEAEGLANAHLAKRYATPIDRVR